MPEDEKPPRDDIAPGGDDLTEDERRAFRELPREATPSELLEARTVRALRDAGWIEAARSRHAGGWTPARAAAAVAACLVLFAGGFMAGRAARTIAPRPTTGVAGGVRPSPGAGNEIARLQHQRSQYFAALESLTQGTAAADAARAAQLRDAASQTLRSAAEQMLRLAPEDALATGILQAMDLPGVANADSSATGTRRVVWF